MRFITRICEKRGSNVHERYIFCHERAFINAFRLSKNRYYVIANIRVNQALSNSIWDRLDSDSINTGLP